MNIINTIEGAWREKESTGILCMDFSKAFDSVKHEAIRGVLEFFNFGPNIVNMVMTLLNGRKSRVIMEEGYSSHIKIDRGTPQEDRASPYIFILVIEVLLIKIRSMEGGGINCCMHIGRWVENIDIEKLTAEAYADDLTLIFSMIDGAVECIVKMMDDFGRVTGLTLNKNCAADFSLLNLPKGKSLGRSKPATNS
jgi:hypothetical protein